MPSEYLLNSWMFLIYEQKQNKRKERKLKKSRNKYKIFPCVLLIYCNFIVCNTNFSLYNNLFPLRVLESRQNKAFLCASSYYRVEGERGFQLILFGKLIEG